LKASVVRYYEHTFALRECAWMVHREMHVRCDKMMVNNYLRDIDTLRN